MKLDHSFKFHKNDIGEYQTVSMDLIDLHFLCRQALNKNTPYFHHMLKIIHDIPNADNKTNIHITFDKDNGIDYDKEDY